MQSSVFTIPNGKFVLKNGLNKKGEKGIYLLYYINNVRVYASSKVFVKPGDWDESNQKVKTKNLNHEAKNSRLVQFRKDVEKLIYEYGKPLDAQKLRDLLSGKIKTKAAVEEEKQSSDFIQYANDYIERCYKLGKLAYSTYANDLHSIDMFRRYILEKTGEDSLPLKEITILTIDEYKEYCLEKKNKKQSTNKKLKPLIKTIAYASRSRLIDAVLANEICEIGYFDLKDRKYESEVDEGEVRYLDKSQLQELVNMYNKVKYSRTREFIDIFMFSFHACGLRFSDLLTLEWSHIDWENKKLTKNLYKGKIRHTIYLQDMAMEILQRWKEKKYNKRFVFDLLPAEFDIDNEEELNKKRLSKNRCLQTSLHELGKHITVHEKDTEDNGKKLKHFRLSIHVARHTYAVWALEAGVPLTTVSEILAHGSVTTTEKSYAKYLPESIEKEVSSKTNFIILPKV